MLTIIGFIIIFFTSLLFGIILLKKDFVLGLIFLFGLILRIICSFAQDLYHIAPYDWDETAFFQMGLKMYEFFLGNTNSIPFENLTGVPTYGSFLGIIFYFFEPNTLLVRVINSLLGAIIIVLTYKLAREIDIERRSSLIVSCLVAFTPSYIIYSSLIMRDIIIWILLIIVVIQWVKTIQNNNYINFIIGLAFALILIPLRKQYILILALFAMFTLMIVWFRKDLKYANVKITAIKYLLIFCVLTITIIISYQLLIVEISRWGNSQLMEYIISQVNWRAQGGSAYLTTLEYSSISDIILHIPIKFAHFTFGPFLWTSTSMFVLLSAIESLIGTYIFLNLLFNYKHVFRMDMKEKKIINFITLFAITGLILSAIIDSNYGTAMRHRMVFMPLIFVAAFSLKNKINRKIIPENKYAQSIDNITI